MAGANKEEKEKVEENKNLLSLKKANEYYIGLSAVNEIADLPTKLSYRIGRNFARLTPLIKESDKQRVVLQAKHGVKQKNAKGTEGYALKTIQAREDFEKELEEFLESVQEDIPLFSFEEEMFKLDAPEDEQYKIPGIFFEKCGDLIIDKPEAKK